MKFHTCVTAVNIQTTQDKNQPESNSTESAIVRWHWQVPQCTGVHHGRCYVVAQLSQGAPPLTNTTAVLHTVLFESLRIDPPLSFLCSLFSVYQGPAVYRLENAAADV